MGARGHTPTAGLARQGQKEGGERTRGREGGREGERNPLADEEVRKRRSDSERDWMMRDRGMMGECEERRSCDDERR